MLTLPLSEEGTATSPPGSYVEAPSEAWSTTNPGIYTPSSRERPCWLLHHHVLCCCSCSPSSISTTHTDLWKGDISMWGTPTEAPHCQTSTNQPLVPTTRLLLVLSALWSCTQAIPTTYPTRPLDAKAHRCILDSNSHTIQAQLHQGTPHTTHPPRLIKRAK